MAKLSDWERYAAQHKGIVVAWINQPGAASIKQANSNGVCRAITRSWIDSCRGDTAAQIEFLKKFRAYGPDGKMLDANVPDEYIEQQVELSKAFNTSQIQFAALTKDVLDANADAKTKLNASKQDYDAALLKAQQALSVLEDFVKAVQGGQGCFDAKRFKTVDLVIAELKNQSAQSQYYGLSMTGPSGFGHVVGFEFRSDRQPASYQFLDANSGLFYFTAADDMLDFVEKKIWLAFYSNQPIGIFGLFLYDLGLDQTMSDEERKSARTDYPAKLIPEKTSDWSCVIC